MPRQWLGTHSPVIIRGNCSIVGNYLDKSLRLNPYGLTVVLYTVFDLAMYYRRGGSVI